MAGRAYIRGLSNLLVYNLFFAFNFSEPIGR